MGRFLRSWRCRHDGSTRAKCGRAARGAVQSGPQAGYQWRAPRCPPRTRPGHSGGHLATHATQRPVTDGSGNAFAMRRPGVRIPAAPQRKNPAPPAQTLKSGRGFVIVVCPSCASVPLRPSHIGSQTGSRKPWVWSERVNEPRPTSGAGQEAVGIRLSLPQQAGSSPWLPWPSCLARSQATRGQDPAEGQNSAARGQFLGEQCAGRVALEGAVPRAVRPVVRALVTVCGRRR